MKKTKKEKTKTKQQKNETKNKNTQNNQCWFYFSSVGFLFQNLVSSSSLFH